MIAESQEIIQLLEYEHGKSKSNWIINALLDIFNELGKFLEEGLPPQKTRDGYAYGVARIMMDDVRLCQSDLGKRIMNFVNKFGRKTIKEWFGIQEH